MHDYWQHDEVSILDLLAHRAGQIPHSLLCVHRRLKGGKKVEILRVPNTTPRLLLRIWHTDVYKSESCSLVLLTRPTSDFIWTSHTHPPDPTGQPTDFHGYGWTHTLLLSRLIGLEMMTENYSQWTFDGSNISHLLSILEQLQDKQKTMTWD